MTEVALLDGRRSVRRATAAQAAVERCRFEIARGRCLGVIGESGAGKTQAFLAMMGLLPAQRAGRGRARLAAQRLLGPARGRRCAAGDVAMIFQDPMTSLTPHLRIGDQIAEPLVDASRHELATTRAARPRRCSSRCA